MMEIVPLATLAGRIRELRIKAGLSQEALAARAHVTLRTIARIEAPDNDRVPYRSTIVLIAAALDVHPDTLLYSNGENEAA